MILIIWELLALERKTNFSTLSTFICARNHTLGAAERDIGIMVWRSKVSDIWDIISTIHKGKTSNSGEGVSNS
jgi:hypothetical protein